MTLVLSRRLTESLTFDAEGPARITVALTGLKNTAATLAIDAPATVKVTRTELFDRAGQPDGQPPAAPTTGRPGPAEAWMQTYSGQRFPLTAPAHELAQHVRVADIAHALAQIPRFNGHTRQFYSVAQHSIAVAQQLNGPAQLALAGLFHDSAEAYLGDLTRPVRLLWPAIRRIEKNILLAIAMRLGLDWPLPQSVWEADNRQLAHEHGQVMPRVAGLDWGDPPPAGLPPIECWSPAHAEDQFLWHVYRLSGRYPANIDAEVE